MMTALRYQRKLHLLGTRANDNDWDNVIGQWESPRQNQFLKKYTSLTDTRAGKKAKQLDQLELCLYYKK